jgi:phosphoribosylformimino-5-aminoimidazole carboxamide ribotide isomerase
VILYPAIDIRDGRAVRLLRGDYERETAYDADPAEAARRWAAEGAELLHVVDLDGARAGAPRNLEAVRRIADLGCPIQVGGGLRDPDALGAVLGAGAERVVIGTAALRDPEFLDRALAEHGERVVVSVDARGGRVSLAGWTEGTDRDAAATVAELAERGVKRFLCTEIDVDGTMEGPAVAELERICAASGAAVIASGGVGTLADLRALATLGASHPNLEGAIVGRALYERRFTVAEGIAALSG